MFGHSYRLIYRWFCFASAYLVKFDIVWSIAIIWPNILDAFFSRIAFKTPTKCVKWIEVMLNILSTYSRIHFGTILTRNLCNMICPMCHTHYPKIAKRAKCASFLSLLSTVKCDQNPNNWNVSDLAANFTCDAAHGVRFCFVITTLHYD